MYKRTFAESSSAEEPDPSDISKPATKIIRVDETPKSNFSDKCIQVDTETCNVETANDNAVENMIVKNVSNDDEITFDFKLESSQANSSDYANNDSTLHQQSITSDPVLSENNDDVIGDKTIFKQYNGQNLALSSTNNFELVNTQQNSTSPENYGSSCSDTLNEIVHLSNSSTPSPSCNEKIIKSDIEYNDESSNSSSSDHSTINVPCEENDSARASSTGMEADVTARPLQGALKVPGRKPKHKRSVYFNGVTVYYFRRAQGFTCVPSQGGSTLGMENTHIYSRDFTLESHADERKRAHREILLRHRRFAKMNKNSSTSESEDDSCDDFSDISDVDLENDNCYFLQPVPIKQRRALLRASGVRKIETAEKEECRDIRLSRETCGCDCQLYCNPDRCSCHLAGIKCQVDRMSFPCGCSRDGCSNSNGRIEFNPLRVRTHFIHTIMRIEMEKKQNQQERDDIRNAGPNNNIISSTVGYCPSTSNYSQPIVNQCNQSIPQQDLYMPMQNNQAHYSAESSHMLITTNNNYSDPNCVNIFNNEYSPDNSSYSENSDYTSDDFEDEMSEKTRLHKQQPPQQQHDLYSQHANFSNSNMIHAVSSMPPQNNPNILPPFPSINSSCDISSSYKNNHCHASYQDSSMHLNHYDSYSSFGNAIQQQQAQTHPQLPPPPHTSVYSYDHLGTTHYGNYSNAFHNKSPDNFVSNVSGNHLPTAESGGSEQQAESVAGRDNATTQQYIDISLSIASSLSAESLLSAANTSDEDSRLTPVSFAHVQPLSSSSSFYPLNGGSSNNLCDMPPISGCGGDEGVGVNREITTYNEVIGTDQKSDSSSSSSSENLSPNDNFCEIIKKTIVESVSA